MANMMICYNLHSQCVNTEKFPAENIQAPGFDHEITVTDKQYAGQYYVIEGLSLGETYMFSSSEKNDYITIMDAEKVSFLAHGLTPLSYGVSGDDILSVHINLSSPTCGTETVSRKTSVICQTCPPVPPGIGINKNNPESALDISGEILIGGSVHPPKAGMIRWNESLKDFEGFDGEKWRSFTQSTGSWGVLSSDIVNENQKVISPTTSIIGFGSDVSLTSEYAVIGARLEDIGLHDSQGAAYIRKRNENSWEEMAKIIASDGDTDDQFGSSVGIYGDYAVIGAWNDQIGVNYAQGSAYVFRRSGDTWIQQTKLVASDGQDGDAFGNSVAISGNKAIIGMLKNDGGRAYIFRRDGDVWTQEAKLSPASLLNDFYGEYVDISGDYAIVSRRGEDFGPGLPNGAVYIYYYDGIKWGLQEKITLTNPDVESFGTSVAISDNYAVIGAMYEDVNGNLFQGAAYVYERSGSSWNFQKRLLAEDNGFEAHFGGDVSISGENIVVGAYKDNYNKGAAYVFSLQSSSWIQTNKLLASDQTNFHNLGTRVAILGDYISVASGTNPNGNIYFYHK